MHEKLPLDVIAAGRAKPFGSADDVSATVGFVLDSDPEIRQAVATALSAYGIRPIEFSNLSAMMAVSEIAHPQIIFVDPGIPGAAAVPFMEQLARGQFRCPIQLMTNFSEMLIEDPMRVGLKASLNMLPAIHKPLKGSAVRQILRKANLKQGNRDEINVNLGEAIARRWLEIWYQPKIDLQTRKLVGAEALIRCLHPEHGTILPDFFVADADEENHLSLAQFVLVKALHDWRDFADIGSKLRFSVNMPMAALMRLPLRNILLNERSFVRHWPGIIFEVQEHEAVREIDFMRDLAKKLEPHHVEFSLDDIGSAVTVISKTKKLPFCEFKIDRSYIKDCDTNANNSGICETIINLAHRSGIQATAGGIETPAELETLRTNGCDFGQGYLFARPMPKRQLEEILRKKRPTRE